jgi:hypothetical protein
MGRINAFTLAALIGSALLVLLAMPVYAQNHGDYADIDDDYYADTYNGKHHQASSYEPVQSYLPPQHYAYGHQKRQYGYDYPRSRKACIYGPIRQKRVCDYEPKYCWKERECYRIYGKNYCRTYNKCRGGGKRCYWVNRHAGGHSSCYY